MAFTFAFGFWNGRNGRGAGGAISDWILATNFWRDVGFWRDTSFWQD